jgi:heme A synthase
LIPDFHNHHVVIEFTHRVVAGIVVILLGTLLVKAFRLRQEHPELFRPALAAFLLVLFQAGLGAVVVKLHLEKQSVMLHLGAAMAVVATLVYLVGKASALGGAFSPPEDRSFNRKAQLAAGSVFALLLIGSYTTGTGSGYAFSDWPLMGGRLIPDLSVTERAIHFVHRVTAAGVGVYVFLTMLSIIKRKAETPLGAKFAHAAIGLFGIQVAVGAANVWTTGDAGFVTAHLLLGALIWTALVAVAVVTHPGIEGA